MYDTVRRLLPCKTGFRQQRRIRKPDCLLHSIPTFEPGPQSGAITSSGFTLPLNIPVYALSTSTMESATIIAEISRGDLQGFSTPPSASITDVKHLSSYNWIEAPTPTIAVPGGPSLWTPPKHPRQVNKDSGVIYIAQNAARHPDSPLEPLFRALYIAKPSFDIRSTDVVTDRNNIRKLLSFINPFPAGKKPAKKFEKKDESFTITIEVVGDTAIFCRSETVTKEIIGPDKHIGFGHEFEKAYTTNQISGSTGHHRVISYSFSGLNFIVRYETDGYVATGAGVSSSSSSKVADSESDSLASMLGSLALSSSNSPPYTTPHGSKLTVKEEGKVTALESTLEIKTRSSRNHLPIEEVIPQLWVSQTSKFVIAYHHNGMFQPPEVQDVMSEIKKWEERNQADLRKLAALVNKIRDVVKGCGGKAVLTYDVNGGKLVIRKDNGNKLLPQDLYSKWHDSNQSEAETKTKHDADTDSAGNHGTEAEPKAENKRNVPGPRDGTEVNAKADDQGIAPGAEDGTGVNTKPEAKSIVPSPKDTKGKGKATAAEKGGPVNKSPDSKPAKSADSAS